MPIERVIFDIPECDMAFKQLKLIGLMAILLTQCALCIGFEVNKKQDQNQRYFEYQQASTYTHLNWAETVSEKISLSLKPIINYSGIPIENREEKAEYFNYGKLPQIMNNIYLDAFAATRLFQPSLANSLNKPSDYQVELIIDQFDLPFKYAADDHWWEKLHDQTDRWLKSPANAGIKLTIKITSGSKKIKPWIDSVKMVLSNCDLNAMPQPQTSGNNKNELTKLYLSTIPGQPSLAATNFLVYKTIQRLNQQPLLGNVVRKYQDQIYLSSQSANFSQGQVLDLFYNNVKTGKAEFCAGQVKVIKTFQNHATAFPISLRSDHITVGDWVEINNPVSFEHPPSTFVAAGSCADVSSSVEVVSL